MFRFLKFLLLNLLVVGSFGWMQTSGFDWDAVRTRTASPGFRTGGTAAHK